MDDESTHRSPDHHDGPMTGERPTTPERRAAEQACDDLLQRIETAARQALAAEAHGPMQDDTALAALVRQYARCARSADMRPERMVKPLKVAMSRFFYDRRERADDLLRLAVLEYFEITPPDSAGTPG